MKTYRSKTDFVAHHINRLLEHAAFGLVRKPPPPIGYLSISEFAHLIQLLPSKQQRSNHLMDVQATVKTLNRTLNDNIDHPDAWIPLRRADVETIAAEFGRLAKLEADLVNLVEANKTPSAAEIVKKNKGGRTKKIVAVTDLHVNGINPGEDYLRIDDLVIDQ